MSWAINCPRKTQWSGKGWYFQLKSTIWAMIKLAFLYNLQIEESLILTRGHPEIPVYENVHKTVSSENLESPGYFFTRTPFRIVNFIKKSWNLFIFFSETKIKLPWHIGWWGPLWAPWDCCPSSDGWLQGQVRIVSFHTHPMTTRLEPVPENRSSSWPQGVYHINMGDCL